MYRKVKQDFVVKKLAGCQVEIDEEATGVLALGIFPGRGLFGKWAFQEFCDRRPEVTFCPVPSVKLYFGAIKDPETDVNTFIILAEDELEVENV